MVLKYKLREFIIINDIECKIPIVKNNKLI